MWRVMTTRAGEDVDGGAAVLVENGRDLGLEGRDARGPADDLRRRKRAEERGQEAEEGREERGRRERERKEGRGDSRTGRESGREEGKEWRGGVVGRRDGGIRWRTGGQEGKSEGG
eukprot:1747579-Rhodomonas_salina.1